MWMKRVKKANSCDFIEVAFQVENILRDGTKLCLWVWVDVGTKATRYKFSSSDSARCSLLNTQSFREHDKVLRTQNWLRFMLRNVLWM